MPTDSFARWGGWGTAPEVPSAGMAGGALAVADELPEAAARVREAVIRATARRPAECMLLSGGLDTAILAPLAHAGGMRAAVTVLTCADAPDRPFAVAVASRLRWRHYVVEAPFDDLLTEMDFVVRTLRSFDPMEVRNSVVIA